MSVEVPVYAATEPMVPIPYRVTHRKVETADSVTIRLEPVGARLVPFEPGQFTMLYVHGIGEVPISISGDPAGPEGCLVHTIRDVGAVSHALCHAEPGSVVGVRGPYGTNWRLGAAVNHDLLLVAGGIGLAPLRPVLLGALAERDHYRRIVLIAGARRPEDFLFRDELAAWSGRPDLTVELTVDVPAPGWTGGVGFVTEPLARLDFDPRGTAAFLCGPEPMMRYSARILLRDGLPATAIRVSLERDMKCGIGLCGHCQLGPLLLCRDGPVVDYRVAEPLLMVREL